MVVAYRRQPIWLANHKAMRTGALAPRRRRLRVGGKEALRRTQLRPPPLQHCLDVVETGQQKRGGRKAVDDQSRCMSRSKLGSHAAFVNHSAYSHSASSCCHHRLQQSSDKHKTVRHEGSKKEKPTVVQMPEGARTDDGTFIAGSFPHSEGEHLASNHLPLIPVNRAVKIWISDQVGYLQDFNTFGYS